MSTENVVLKLANVIAANIDQEKNCISVLDLAETFDSSSTGYNVRLPTETRNTRYFTYDF